ncbi:hypothetical protein [Actinomadura opuntiae]|uniref:hypothetical protein n=1 Tax=Actinomadura sp. OS1-43 TaxID=604315 RepID=UPI00255B3777|nr:hypothetical protein [Actinomadura sp. OS1-43]MDL4814711.1 hypothetical protein [Actinomadura sp. OS1-43]
MSNGARHGMGAVVGLVATPVVGWCLLFGTNKMLRATRTGLVQYRSYHGSELWIGALVLLVAAVVIGLLVGSRLSPLASLVPGVVYGALGALWIADPIWATQHTSKKPLPDNLLEGYLLFAPMGMFLLLGVLLTVASVPPSRWRARTPGAPRYAGPPPAPAMPMGAPQAPAQDTPWGSPPQYGQQPQYGPGAQQGYGQGGSQPALPSAPLPNRPRSSSAPPPARPASGAVPFDDGRDDARPSAQGGGSGEGVGEWTQMYGGDDLRGDR